MKNQPVETKNKNTSWKKIKKLVVESTIFKILKYLLIMLLKPLIFIYNLIPEAEECKENCIRCEGIKTATLISGGNYECSKCGDTYNEWADKS